MVYHSVARIYWLFFLVVPGRVHSGYLKSAGDIKILEGETCIIEWTVYNAEERVAPCSWWFAHNVTEEAHLFLAYEDGKKYAFGKLGQWHFTNSKDPCKGGMEKKITFEDAGVYTMQTQKGNLLMKEEAETSVEVLNGSDLKFSVFVNDKVKTFNVSGGLEWTLEKLKTDVPVNVSVVLSKAFPPSTVTITSNSGEGYCNDPYKGCHHVTDLNEMTDVSVLIKIKTGIRGASQIMITQPVTYSPPVDNRHRNASIIFGLLLFVLLSIIIVMIILLIWTNRKARKQNVTEVERNEGGKLKMSQVIRKKMKDNITDFTVAFKVNKENKSDEVKNIFIGQEKSIIDLKMKIKSDQANVMSELMKCKNQVELAQSSVEKILCTSKHLMDTMTKIKIEMEDGRKLDQSQHEQYEITRLQIQRVSEIEKHLISFKNDFLRYDNKIKNFKQELKPFEKEEREVGEQVTEVTKMIDEKEGVQHRDIQEQFQEILDMNSQLTKLQCASTEILEGIKDRNTTLEDATSSINQINEHFEKIQKGWNFTKKGTDVESSSVKINKPKKETEEKSAKKKWNPLKKRNKPKKETEEKSANKKCEKHKEEGEKKFSEREL